MAYDVLLFVLLLFNSRYLVRGSLSWVASGNKSVYPGASKSCVCVVIDTTCNIYVVVLLGWQSEYLVPPGVSSETYAPA